MNKTALLTAMTVTMACAGAAHAADIELWYGNTGATEQAILAQCDAFNASQTDHKITCVGQGTYEVAMQKAIAAYRAGETPALIQFLAEGALDIILSDAVIPVQGVIPDADWSSYVPATRSYYETSTGELYAQPWNASTLVFYTNKTMLEAAGVTKTPETWEEVIEAARKLKAAGNACPFATNAEPWSMFEQFSARHGLPIASNDNGYGGLDAEYVFNTTFFVEHLKNMVEWRKEGLVKIPADLMAANYAQAFASGECAMVENSTGAYPSAVTGLEGKGEVTLSLTPMYEGYERHNTFVGGGALYAMKGHSDAEMEAVRAFLNFAREPEQQLAFSTVTGTLPVTKAALETALGMEDGSTKFPTAALGIESMSFPGLPHTKGIRLGFYLQFRQMWMEEVQKAFAGDKEAQVALDDAKTRGDELLRRFEQTYQGVTLP
jgi:sn-glycerol 3-phosphate transport system substrate-binding protein